MIAITMGVDWAPDAAKDASDNFGIFGMGPSGLFAPPLDNRRNFVLGFREKLVRDWVARS